MNRWLYRRPCWLQKDSTPLSRRMNWLTLMLLEGQSLGDGDWPVQTSGGRRSSGGGLGWPARGPDWDTGSGWSEDAGWRSCRSCSSQYTWNGVNNVRSRQHNQSVSKMPHSWNFNTKTIITHAPLCGCRLASGGWRMEVGLECCSSYRTAAARPLEWSRLLLSLCM